MGMLVILESIYNRVIQNWRSGRRTWVFVDEFSIFFRYPFATNFFLRMWKQVRKRAGYMTGITQNVGEMLTSKDACWMLANSEFLIMLSQSASDRAALAELLNISDTQLSYVENADPGCGLMKFGGAFIPFVNSFPEDTGIVQAHDHKTGRPGAGKAKWCINTRTKVMLQRYILRPRPGAGYLTAALTTRPIAIREEQALVRARSCVLKQTFEYRVQTVPKEKVPQEACNQAICDCNSRPHDKR